MDNELIKLNWQHFINEFVTLKSAADMPFTFEEIRNMPVKMKDYIFKYFNEIKEARKKALNGLK